MLTLTMTDDAGENTASKSCANCRYCPDLANSPDHSEWICKHPEYRGRLWIGHEPTETGSDCIRHKPHVDDDATANKCCANCYDICYGKGGPYCGRDGKPIEEGEQAEQSCGRHRYDLDEQTEEITRMKEELHPRRPANEPPPDGSKPSAPPTADRANAWQNAALALDDAARELDDALGELRYAKEMSAAAYHAGTGYEPDHTAAAHAARILPDQDSRTKHTAVDLVCMARRAREAGEALIQHAIDEDNESPES